VDLSPPAAGARIIEMYCDLAARPDQETAETLCSAEIDQMRARSADYGDVWSRSEFDDMWSLVWGLPTVHAVWNECGHRPAWDYVSLLMYVAFEPGRHASLVETHERPQ
jgi:hypothetical protein